MVLPAAAPEPPAHADIVSIVAAASATVARVLVLFIISPVVAVLAVPGPGAVAESVRPRRTVGPAVVNGG
ncbi:hypothetical protein GCM10027063_16940 [Promicromonospora xylanilytica]